MFWPGKRQSGSQLYGISVILTCKAVSPGICWWRNQGTAAVFLEGGDGPVVLLLGQHCLASRCQPASVELCTLHTGLFRNELLCMGIMWDIWACAYSAMAKVKACTPHLQPPTPPPNPSPKLTFQPLCTFSHQFGDADLFMIICLLYMSS